jgi:hypothetical protein
MRHLEADHGDTYPQAWYSLIDGFGHLLSECRELLIGSRVEVKKVIDLFLWHYECVPFTQRIDVEKGKTMLILRYFVAGNFAIDDTCEDGSQAN